MKKQTYLLLILLSHINNIEVTTLEMNSPTIQSTQNIGNFNQTITYQQNTPNSHHQNQDLNNFNSQEQNILSPKSYENSNFTLILPLNVITQNAFKNNYIQSIFAIVLIFFSQFTINYMFTEIQREGNLVSTAHQRPDLFFILKLTEKIKPYIDKKNPFNEENLKDAFLMLSEHISKEIIAKTVVDLSVNFLNKYFIKSNILRAYLKYFLKFNFFSNKYHVQNFLFFFLKDDKNDKNLENLEKRQKTFINHSKALMWGFIGVLIAQYLYDIILFNTHDTYIFYLKIFTALLMAAIMTQAIHSTSENNILIFDLFDMANRVYFFVGLIRFGHLLFYEKNNEKEKIKETALETAGKIKSEFESIIDDVIKWLTGQAVKEKETKEDLSFVTRIKNQYEQVKEELNKVYKTFEDHQYDDFIIDKMPYLNIKIDITKKKIYVLIITITFLRITRSMYNSLKLHNFQKPKEKEENYPSHNSLINI